MGNYKLLQVKSQFSKYLYILILNMILKLQLPLTLSSYCIRNSRCSNIKIQCKKSSPAFFSRGYNTSVLLGQDTSGETCLVIWLFPITITTPTPHSQTCLIIESVPIYQVVASYTYFHLLALALGRLIPPRHQHTSHTNQNMAEKTASLSPDVDAKAIEIADFCASGKTEPNLKASSPNTTVDTTNPWKEQVSRMAALITKLEARVSELEARMDRLESLRDEASCSG